MLMKILLTGPHGQIGWELSRCLTRLGEVIPLDRAQLDLADAGSIRQAVRRVRPDVIVNAAGYTAVDRAESEPELAKAVNATGAGVLADEAAATGAALISYSTDYVFDGRLRRPYRPDDEPNPLNTYARTKLEGERLIVASGASAIVLRTSWVYSMRRTNFVLTMLRMALKPEIRVVSDQQGCPSWSRRIAEGTADIIERGLSRGSDGRLSFGAHAGTYHLACRGITTWCDLARLVFEIVRAEPMPRVTAIPSSEYPTPAKRPPYSALDCTLTRDAFGVDLGPWEDALAEALQDDAAVAAAGGQKKEES
jgi:dTDP-4-dehydrorhamnose reductase